MSDFWDGAAVISSYSRAQAIADGTLVDITEAAKEAGWKYPVAVTRTVWEDVIGWTTEDDLRKPGTGQSTAGRLWDVVWMARCAAHRASDSRIGVDLYRVPRFSDDTQAELVHLVAVCGPGDTAEPVITIMFPGED